VNERAQAAAAKQKLKRAGGLIREAVRDLAIAADGGALAVALEQRGRLQVQIVASPPTRPTPRPEGAKETP
jgi:hypothetical protein